MTLKQLLAQRGLNWVRSWLLLVLLLLPALAAQGQENGTANRWSGTGELGVVLSRGNSDTETVNANVELAYDPEHWLAKFRAEWLQARDNGENTAKRFNLGLNGQYEFNERSYVFGALRYDDDQFSGFDYQASLALGYGHYLLNSERHVLKLEAGPGVRLSEPVQAGSETNLIARGVIDYRWQLSASASLSNVFLLEAGQNNTFYENKLALTTGITDALRLKMGISVRRNSNVPAGREKTDYLSTANLVYQFL